MDYHHLQGLWIWMVTSEQRIPQLNWNLIVVLTFRHLECE